MTLGIFRLATTLEKYLLNASHCFSFKTWNWIWCATKFYLRTTIIQYSLTDLFELCENDDFASYADDTTPYTCGMDYSLPQRNSLTGLEKSS